MRYFTSLILILVIIAGSLVAFVPEVRDWSMQQAGLMTQAEHQQIVDDLECDIAEWQALAEESQSKINAYHATGLAIYNEASSEPISSVAEFVSAGGITLTEAVITDLMEQYNELSNDTTFIDTMTNIHEILQSAIAIEYEPEPSETANETLINETLSGLSQLSTNYTKLQGELATALQTIADLRTEIAELQEQSKSAGFTLERNWQINYYWENVGGIDHVYMQSNAYGNNAYDHEMVNGDPATISNTLGRQCQYITECETYSTYEGFIATYILSLDSDMARYEGVIPEYEFNATLKMSTTSGYSADYVGGYYQESYGLRSFWNNVYKAYKSIIFGMSSVQSDALGLEHVSYGLVDIVTYDFVFKYAGQDAVHIIDHVFINHLNDGDSTNLNNFNLV